MPPLQLSRITKSYGRKQVLRGASISFPIGLTLLNGPSGAGKSTLLRLVATAERPTSGEIMWEGVPLPAGRQALRRTLGYAPQSVDLPDDLTAREFALHVAALKGLDQGQADRQFIAITSAIGLHADINNRIRTFSGGMRRRLVFAQALLGAPRLIALDEPTAELDSDTARKVSALIIERAQAATVIMTTHLSDDVSAAAAVILRVEDGEVTTA